MDNLDLTQHISQQFNRDLEAIRERVLNMGGLVEQQLEHSLQALLEQDLTLCERIQAGDRQINELEVAIDDECTRILAKRQPAASDLRLVVAILKTITDLERMGDEAERIARMVTTVYSEPVQFDFAVGHEMILNMGNSVKVVVRDALDAFARMDAEAAVKIAVEEVKIDDDYNAILRELVTQMHKSPDAIEALLSVMWAAKALERIGDHARNICEYVVYLVQGTDVRHIGLDQLLKQVAEKTS